MCGISGIILKDKTVKPSILEAMTNVINYRGPDQFGYFYNQNLALGHRRLSILDLSENGRQPFHYMGNVIAYNGEIYNYVELKKELQLDGYQFRTTSDTEVIMAAYHKWGKDCVKRFNGMWAFALYDSRKAILFCSRDRFGIKPFYYSYSNNHFTFGSEIKQLLVYNNKAKLNKSVLMNYLIIGLEEYSAETFFDGVHQLLGGHSLIIDLKKVNFTIEKYYTIAINQSIRELNYEHSLQTLEETFKQSINYRLRSDVKVAGLLSGGIDSSTICATAASIFKNQGSGSFTGITIQSTDKSNDETFYASLVAEQSKLNWLKTKPTETDFLASVKDVINTLQEPFSSLSIFMEYFLYQKIKTNNIKVILDGQGGDEVFLGYERYYMLGLANHSNLEKLKRSFSISKNSKLSLKDVLSYYFYFTNATIRKQRLLHKHSFIKKAYFDYLDFELIKQISKSFQSADEMQILEVSKTLLPQHIKLADKISMKHSIETRLPYLDHNLVELGLSLNFDFKMQKGWTKYILRDLLSQSAKKEVAWRKKKIGFEAPEKQWTSLLPSLPSIVKDSEILSRICKQVPVQVDNRLHWKLYNIAIWEKEFNVSW